MFKPLFENSRFSRGAKMYQYLMDWAKRIAPMAIAGALLISFSDQAQAGSYDYWGGWGHHRQHDWHGGKHHDTHRGRHFGSHDKPHYDPWIGYHWGRHYGPHGGGHHDWHEGGHHDWYN